MSFNNYQFKRGILRQGCYLDGFATKPSLLRCRLPILLVTSLTDLGRWQLIKIDNQIYRTPEMQAASWRVDQLLNTVTQESDLMGSGAQGTNGLMPLNTIAEYYWRADTDTLEKAVLRLKSFPDDLLKKRLARVLEHLTSGQSQQGNQTDPVI